MAEERRVHMVRLEREEEYFDREEVLGRDTASVFPKTAATDASTSRQANADMITMIGGRNFISESELAKVKASRGGGTAEDGNVEEALKPLVEVLREAKQAKQEAFDNQWKQMKQGKNRALEPDELAFMDALRDEELTRDREVRHQEDAELLEFRRALAKAKEDAEAAAADGLGAATSAALPQPAAKRPHAVAKPALKLPVKPAIRVKPKAPSALAAPVAAAAGEGPEAKKAKTEEAAVEEEKDKEASDDGGGLAGLLGGYGSDSD
ncbi:hypothetical protein FOA52_003496 [Chlamydomonas sp. UWO 241]|nr:hypothetical protein FOA52_003496 [Chlamydomonas sp. UWO 241]